MTSNGLVFVSAASKVAPCCGARKIHRAYADPRIFRPLPLAQLAFPATGSARIAPPNGLARLRASHGGCNMPLAYC